MMLLKPAAMNAVPIATTMPSTVAMRPKRTSYWSGSSLRT